VLFKNILADEQHGFRKMKSTETNLIVFYSHLIDVVKSGGRVDAIYTDLRKAFDSVDHGILMLKLKKLGIIDPLLTWFSSYLSNRSFRVMVDGVLSNNKVAISGVPQGSHLSPLLFLLFINDVGLIFKSCKYLLFADDLKMYLPINSMNDSIQLQHVLDTFSLWCLKNSLSLNVDKCKCISYTRQKNKSIFPYTINGFIISYTSIIRDLGVLMSSDLTFNAHIDSIYSIALRVIGLTKRNCMDFKNIICLKVLYYSLVR